MGEHIFKLFNSDIEISRALIYVLIGVGVVFLCLVIIIGLLTLLDLIFRFDLFGKFTGLFKRKEKQQIAQPTTVSDTTASAVAEDEETIAAITAAISLMLTDETGKPVPFRIKKIRHM